MTTTLATVSAGAGADTVVNENFVAASPAALYGRRAPGTFGLTWGFYGGRAWGNTVADGTVSLTASSTNYVVANRSTGAVSTDTATTNWVDTVNYLKLYEVTTDGSAITGYIDERMCYA